MNAPHWQTGRFRLDLSRPQVMGIVNVTPDSFSDGGVHASPSEALAHCERLVREGADILDIGGESTRPGSVSPAAHDELVRVLPILRGAVTLGVAVSVDTSEPMVMRAALDMGVDIVNDVRSLRRDGALDVVAAHPSAGVCVMHMRGEPATMQQLTGYTDVVAEVAAWLRQRRDEVHAAGVALDRIAVDPGIGFAKTAEDNWALLRCQEELLSLAAPLVLGWSRKGALGLLTGRPVQERQFASVAAALACVQRGAQVVRVHDVAATVDALKVWRAAGLP